jgi:2-keto-4-pentenoate hydratase/2-oxohepta-3-ene-1,7-dioic acid hydratase in catechol pathway
LCEIELAAVIGKPCRNVSEEDSLDYVGGYFLSSDLTCFRWKPISPFGDSFYMKFWENMTPVSNFIEASAIADPGNVQLDM